MHADEHVRRDLRVELVGAELAPDRLREHLGEARHDLELLRSEGGRLLDDPREGREPGRAHARALADLHPPQRRDDRLVRPPAADRVDEGSLPRRHLVEEEVLLRREVVEDRLLRHVGGRGHLGDRHMVEPAGDKQLHGLVGDLLPDPNLLRLTKSHDTYGNPIVTVAERI